jgi:hypothetical protein
MELYKSTATNRMVFMTDSADGKTGKTGLTLTITASKAGGAFASISPTVTERGSGWYSLALTASHTDTLGDLALNITASGADAADKLYQIVPDIAKSAFIVTESALTVTNTTTFVVTSGPTNDIANVMAIFFDASKSGSPIIAEGSYVGLTKTLALSAAPAVAVDAADTVTLYAVASNTLGTDAISEAALSAAAVTKIQTGLATPTNITEVGSVTGAVGSVTGHTPQTGDAFARLGAPAGASMSADVAAAKTVVDAILVDTNELQVDLTNGGRLDLLIDALTIELAKVKKLGETVRHTLNSTSGTPGEAGAYDETTEIRV